MKYFITSDIHSYFNVLDKELKKQGFNKDHDTLITLGDNFDRGEESWKMYRFLSKLPNVILVRGNHEDLLEELINRGYPLDHDFHNGTAQTIYDIATHYSRTKDLNIYEAIEAFKDTSFYNWFKNATWVDKVEFNNLILTHATYPNDSFPSWEDARWANPYYNRVKDKILICGHWFAWKGRDYKNNTRTLSIELEELLDTEEGREELAKPFIEKDLIMIDACTTLTKKCNILIYDDESCDLSYNDKVICNSKDKYIEV